ncbi:hypothetical protein A3B45_02420 [Candidatus Daviesbacteria bacterium RIFCSPLOWO2_01_FULL_39_12]|uniref:Uncharacterized protein n=1 Tax=Candidatus Daviesbacteria bacterium RIFCSPLOWO2_01_FULL_39_12 TaxID=1797785 RepID=A0A1F5KSG7_9BACT|nr:MAG: hypothetical protein A3B45_02420 [Candidatus Daviesbacteria bacterium RIFCSPLOWO2_01_FULL_39_12]
MFKLFKRILPALIWWGIFIYVILQIPYPESITQANIIQLLTFFFPLFLAATLTLNIFLKNIFISTSLSLGLIMTLFLKALDSLNLVTGILLIISVGLLISYFRKIRKKSLTNYSKIPKLTHVRK